MKLSLQQLSERADVPGRTVRFYIQKGLLPGPEGEKRGAYYTDAHLAELLRIRQWQDAGLSLDAIASLLQARSEPPVAPVRPGAIEVRSHLIVADGIELFDAVPDLQIGVEPVPLGAPGCGLLAGGKALGAHKAAYGDGGQGLGAAGEGELSGAGL